ncbi:hypothetical protein D3C71_1882000 [compost metagenome]
MQPQRMISRHELRQHRHHEDDALGVGGIGQEATQSTLFPAAFGLLRGRVTHQPSGRAPLLKTDVDQIAGAHDLDDVERGL